MRANGTFVSQTRHQQCDLADMAVDHDHRHSGGIVPWRSQPDVVHRCQFHGVRVPKQRGIQPRGISGNCVQTWFLYLEQDNTQQQQNAIRNIIHCGLYFHFFAMSLYAYTFTINHLNQVGFFLSSYLVPLTLICLLYVGMLLRLWKGAPGCKPSAESRYIYSLTIGRRVDAENCVSFVCKREWFFFINIVALCLNTEIHSQNNKNTLLKCPLTFPYSCCLFSRITFHSMRASGFSPFPEKVNGASREWSSSLCWHLPSAGFRFRWANNNLKNKKSGKCAK